MPNLMDMISRRLWPDTEPDGVLIRWSMTLGRYLFALARDLSTGELNLRAMSLVYTAILAVVPTLGFAFATAKGLGYGEEQALRPLLSYALQPLGEGSDAIIDQIVGFTENIDGGLLTILSVALLLITLISMTQKVESSFNFVWRVDRPRNFMRRFSEYLSVILIGPLLFLLAVTLITGLLGSWITYVGTALPILMTVALFTFLYLFIPNTKVRFRPALLGGCAAGLAWTATGSLFTDLVVSSARWQSIYSGFAIMLILMTWLYLSWLILLLGAQLAFYLQNPFHLPYGQRTAPIDNDARERLSLAVMYLIASDFAEPTHGWTNESLAAKLCVPRQALEPIMNALSNDGLLVRADEQRLIPGRDPHRILLTDILACVRGNAEHWRTGSEPWTVFVDQVAGRIATAIDLELGQRSLGQLVDESPVSGKK